MIKDIVESFKDNVSQKTGNPLLATILIVWTFNNWRLLYGLLFFDIEFKLNDRIAYIESYYLEVNFYKNLGSTIFFSFLVLVGTYVLLAIARIVVDTYDRILIPKISEWTDKSSIMLKSDYINLFKQNEELENKLSIERESRIKAKNELEGIETRFAELVIEKESINQLQVENQKLKDENNKLLEKVESIQDEINKSTYLFNQSELVSRKDEYAQSDKEEIVISKIRDNNEVRSEFLYMGQQVLNRDALVKSNYYTRYFVSLGLLEMGDYSHGEDSYYYKLTDLGKKVYDLFIEHI